MVTEPPCAPAAGDTLVIIGSTAVNSKFALLVIEYTVTVTGPVPGGTALGTAATICELLQLRMEVDKAPLNRTVLAP